MRWDRQKGCLMATDDNNETQSLILQYALITTKNVTISKTASMGTETRESKNSYQIYQCLYASLTRTTNSFLYLKSEDYMIEVTDGSTRIMTPRGPLFLKLIINKVKMANTATAVALRQQVIHLHATIDNLKYKISNCVAHVRRIVTDLAAREETTVDLVDHLITAFLTVPDASFVGHINLCRDFYKERNHLSSEDLPDARAKQIQHHHFQRQMVR